MTLYMRVVDGDVTGLPMARPALLLIEAVRLSAKAAIAAAESAETIKAAAADLAWP